MNGYGAAHPRSGHPRRPGDVVRTARSAAGWTQAALGRRCGCSASQISRWETGRSPLRDIGVLRVLATALGLPIEVFGLIPDNPHGVSGRTLPVRWPTVGPVPVTKPEEDDPMRRRTLLAGAGGLAAGVLAGGSPAHGAADPIRSLGAVLLNPPIANAEPLSLDELRRTVAVVRSIFHQAKYGEVAAVMPKVLARTMATRAELDSTSGVAVANRHLAELYTLTTELMIKVSNDRLAWTAADRALQAADASGDLLTQAATRRSWGIVLRRSGQADTARQLVLDTAEALQPHLRRGPEHLAGYGTLLETAAYTAAVDGDRDTAKALIAEAAGAAARVAPHATAFNPTAVGLYQVSIARVLGDSGTAIEHARRIDPASIPVVERRARYFSDVARAFHQWGKPEQCYRALLAAEHAAPDEVRYRPAIHRITESLVRHPNAAALPGLTAFARRTGVPA
ncbi:helix-turn-helix transcriptional regulator [Amycolatopsis sp.]|uniref:helix-turn-helix domain-containing protein n=1 Tax=Amycolatopsis sp. TaxID=37632 RepID=UPI002D7EC2EB|nr:helix-turn-helix transcriptional regulator [Amycolatopsis sp.]HET6708209.1 helix-turn-helix transcriptional regulator [Amycolatopsis sp.]